MNPIPVFRRPVSLRRSWLFTAGGSHAAHRAALGSGADVIVADLEEFTSKAELPAARPMVANLMSHCRPASIVGAVRINSLANVGLDDLHRVMPGRPDAVFLPHVQCANQIIALAVALDDQERLHGIPAGSTEIVPTIESAQGFINLQEILAASNRICAALLAAEDLTADLGAERGPDSVELNHLRSRFHVECTAADCIAIDCPFNYRDTRALAADLAWARRIGLRAKCSVFPDHIGTIHSVMTPSLTQVAEARDVVARFESAARAEDRALARVETPDFYTARRCLVRAAEFETWADTLRSKQSKGENS